MQTKLYDQSMPTADANNATSSSRINKLKSINNAQSYLEIGVWRGDTFFAVDIPRKVAVDPKFLFPYREHNSSAQEFFELTSDAYFSCPSAGEAKFELIFLDGLHRFEQTFRDFCASLSTAKDNAIWLIDDVYPSDVYSSLPNNGKALAHRRLASGDATDQRWHGDVFKAILAIHDFFPNLSFCTFSAGHNPQTVVVRRPRENFRPIFNNLEAISRVDYFWLRENDGFLNLLPENSVYDWVQQNLVSNSDIGC